jgi:response regulator RpfG family c-di-GMP phosphodiesterase
MNWVFFFAMSGRHETQHKKESEPIMFVHCLRDRVSTEKEREMELVAENISMRAELKTVQERLEIVKTTHYAHVLRLENEHMETKIQLMASDAKQRLLELQQIKIARDKATQTDWVLEDSSSSEERAKKRKAN